MTSRSKPSAQPEQVGTPCSRAVSRRSGIGSDRRPSARRAALTDFEAASQLGSVRQFMEAVGQFDSAVIKFKPLSNVIAAVGRDHFGERCLRGRVVVDDFRSLAAQLRLYEAPAAS